MVPNVSKYLQVIWIRQMSFSKATVPMSTFRLIRLIKQPVHYQVSLYTVEKSKSSGQSVSAVSGYWLSAHGPGSRPLPVSFITWLPLLYYWPSCWLQHLNMREVHCLSSVWDKTALEIYTLIMWHWSWLVTSIFQYFVIHWSFPLQSGLIFLTDMSAVNYECLLWWYEGWSPLFTNKKTEENNSLQTWEWYWLSVEMSSFRNREHTVYTLTCFEHIRIWIEILFKHWSLNVFVLLSRYLVAAAVLAFSSRWNRYC